MPKTKIEKKEVEIDDEIESQKKESKKEIEFKKEEKTKKDIKFKFEGDTQLWKNLIHKVKDLKDEIVLDISKSGLRTTHTDETNVAMVDYVIPKSAFDEYETSHELKIGIDLNKLLLHLRVYGKDLTVDNFGNKLQFKGEKGKTSKMGLLSVVDTSISIPKVEYAVQLKTTAENILTMTEVGEKFSDYLIFRITDNKFHILVEGETDDIRFPICSVSRLKGDKDFETFYSIEYLKQVLKFKGKDNLIIRFGKDTPINIKFDEKDEKCEYLLAPRIESD